MTPHLNQKYDQEVEVCDSSELLKQILGYEVPQGILRDRAAMETIMVTNTARDTLEG